MADGLLPRILALSREYDLMVIGLTTPLGACVDGVRDRRLRRGADPDFDPGNTIDRARRCARTLDRLRAANVKVLMLSRTEALAWCREKLIRHSSKWPSEVRTLAGPDKQHPTARRGHGRKSTLEMPGSKPDERQQLLRQGGRVATSTRISERASLVGEAMRSRRY